ncbi:hypothetical protein GGR57DRAFT_491970 [Xylariaceae sp. FL1272]|nr:hypothetical protein GGR57DRAFT_491970 [Xylariaceae sp. FL1272]
MGVKANWNHQPSSSTFRNVINSVDWARTRLGPRNEWDPVLSQIFRFMMVIPTPTILYWGESQTGIYNEAYAPLVGQKHPSILGKSAPDAFPEFWNDFDKIICEQRENRLTANADASMVLIERHGFLEEAYFDWRLTPVIGENGQVKGSNGISTDVTSEIYRRRQLDTTRKLSELTSQNTRTHHLWSNAIAGSRDNRDLPLVLIYELERQDATSDPTDRKTFRLTGTTGLTPGHSVASDRVDIERDGSGFAPFMRQALDTNSIVVLSADALMAFLVVALNPYRRYDHVCQQFLELVANILSAQYTIIKLTEEVDHRGEMARCASLNLQHSELKFTRFAARSTAGLAMVIFANDACEKFFSSNCSENSDLLSSDSVHSDDMSLLRGWHSRVIQEKQGGTFHLHSKTPFTEICACYADMVGHNEVESVMYIIMDISEMKWIERELLDHTKKLEVSEGNYRSYAKHCLIGICRTDYDGYVVYGNDAWHTHYGFERGTAPHHQKQIVDDVLTLSKLDSELFAMSPSSIFERELKVVDIDLTIVEDESFVRHRVDWVFLDAKRFLQIVINLVSNAIKFTRKSNHRLRGVKFVPRRYLPAEESSAFRPEGKMQIEGESDIFLAFSVTDTGSGISDDQKDLLFNRFAQASPKTHIEYGGSGLGLFISRQITELLGGEIGVGGTLGVGSTFAFYQPVYSAMMDRTPPTPESSSTPSSPRPPRRCILVVEDNLISQKVLCKQLKNRGFAVQAANHGKDALEAISVKRALGSGKHATYFDVILCDIEMPIMGGVEFTQELRRFEASGDLDGRLPIIGVTANVRSGQVAEAMDAGMDGVTTKPYRMHDLIENVDRFCPA